MYNQRVAKNKTKRGENLISKIVNKTTSSGIIKNSKCYIREPVKKKNRKYLIYIWSTIIILMMCQVKLALYQVESDFDNMTEVQKGIAKNILGEEKYIDIAEFSKANITRYNSISRGSDFEVRVTPTPTPITITIQDVGISTNKLTVSSLVMDAVIKTSLMVELDARLGKTLVHTESGYDPKSINVNKGYKNRNGNWVGGSTDYGLTQINSQGGPLGDYFGKKINLTDGRQVEVTNANYKTDMYINLTMGLSSYKHYLTDLCDNNPYIAYACYNAGENASLVFSKYKNKSELTMSEVCSILRKTGNPAYIQASRNIQNNFAMKYQLYFK
jgi:hypothetical protein